MAAKIILYSMPRGDTRTLPIALPLATYSSGASIFFTMKTVVDADATDAAAVVKKTLTDANITSTTTTKNYLLTLVPADTTSVALGTYFAELEFVSSDKATVITYPDPSIAVWKIQITGDITRRTS